MIVYAQIDAGIVTVVALPDGRSPGAMVTCELARDACDTWMLPSRYITMIDDLCGPRSLYVWRSHADMATYIGLIRRASTCRVYRNSVLLPPSMVALMDRNGPIAPSMIRSILQAGGLCTEQAIRQRCELIIRE